MGHSCGEKSDLDVSRKEFEDFLNLHFESFVEKLIGLVKNEKSEVISLQELFLHHVLNSSRGSNNDVDSAFKLGDVIFNLGASSTSMDLNASVFSNSLDDFEDLVSKLSCVN